MMLSNRPIPAKQTPIVTINSFVEKTAKSSTAWVPQCAAGGIACGAKRVTTHASDRTVSAEYSLPVRNAQRLTQRLSGLLVRERGRAEHRPPLRAAQHG